MEEKGYCTDSSHFPEGLCKNLLNNVKPHTTSFVTFGDGAKGEIKGVGDLDCPGVPSLNEVLLVKGLTANLISISQLCDLGFKVNFSKSECLVINDKQEIVMKGVRSKDNCYLWEAENTNSSSVYSIAKEEKEVKLWQHKLGLLHLRRMKRAISMETVRRTPKLQVDDICDVGNKLEEECVVRTLSHLDKDVGNNKSNKFWSKQMLPEYNVTQDVVTLWCDYLKTFNISLNPIDFEEKKSFELEHSFSKLQLTDSSTKALVGNKFENLRGRLGIHQHDKL